MQGVPLAAGATSFLDLLPLALWSAFYPTLLALVVVILGRPQPRRLLIAYYLGGMTMSFVAGAVLIAAFDTGHDVGASNRSIGPGVDFAIGALALLFFWVLLTGRDREMSERRAARKAAKRADKPPQGGPGPVVPADPRPSIRGPHLRRLPLPQPARRHVHRGAQGHRPIERGHRADDLVGRPLQPHPVPVRRDSDRLLPRGPGCDEGEGRGAQPLARRARPPDRDGPLRHRRRVPRHPGRRRRVLTRRAPPQRRRGDRARCPGFPRSGVGGRGLLLPLRERHEQ